MYLDRTNYLKPYIQKNYKRVNGWLGSDTIYQIVRINDIQRDLGIRGHVGEIGVHHGKLFILLYLLAGQGEYGLAIDIFGQQELNVDKSGQGDLEILKNNLKRYAGNISKLKTINADSTKIGAEDIIAVSGGHLRLFSIDGGHLSDIVKHDLETAAMSITDGGVIILDDYFNPEFPGVSEGTNRFFLNNYSDITRKIVPFFMAMNKIYLTTEKYAEKYMDFFTRLDLGLPYEKVTKFRFYDGPSSPIRLTEIFGTNVLSYSPDLFSLKYRFIRESNRIRFQTRSFLSDSTAWKFLKETRFGQFVSRVLNRILPY